MEATTVRPGAAPGTGAVPAVAGGGNEKPAAVAPVTPHAAVTAAKHGGLAGGRKREDGLVPGSKEAKAADLKKDAERKKLARAAERKPDPPAIPSASSATEAQPGAVAVVPGAGSGAPVPWEAAKLKPLVARLVKTAESLAVKQISSTAAKANLPGPILKEIEDKAAWHDLAKEAINESAPAVAAKWLNRTGMSAEHQDELVLGTAILDVAASHVLLLKRIEELVTKANPPVAPAAVPAAQPEKAK